MRLVSVGGNHYLVQVHVIACHSPTNQQFVVLSPALCQSLSQEVAFEVWERKGENEMVCRFVTSWATKKEEVEELDRILQRLVG